MNGVSATEILICRACKAEFLPRIPIPYQCPRCYTFNALIAEYRSVENVTAISQLPSGTIEINRTKPDDGIRSVASINSSESGSPAMMGDIVVEPFDPYPTGIKTFDYVVGGLSRGFSLFIGGQKGAGKTTIVSQISINHCVKDLSSEELYDDRFVFYASAEEPLQRYILRVARLGYLSMDQKGKVLETPSTRIFIKILKTRFMGSRTNEILSLHDEIRRAADRVKMKPSLIIYDSIRKFTHRDIKAPSFLVQGPEVVGEIVDFTEELKCCSIGIVRLTKQGKVAGSEDMGYDVDGVVYLSRIKKRHPLGRVLRLDYGLDGKNRMVDDSRKGLFVLTERGMLSLGKDGSVEPTERKEGIAWQARKSTKKR